MRRPSCAWDCHLIFSAPASPSALLDIHLTDIAAPSDPIDITSIARCATKTGTFWSFPKPHTFLSKSFARPVSSCKKASQPRGQPTATCKSIFRLHAPLGRGTLADVSDRRSIADPDSCLVHSISSSRRSVHHFDPFMDAATAFHNRPPLPAETPQRGRLRRACRC